MTIIYCFCWQQLYKPLPKCSLHVGFSNAHNKLLKVTALAEIELIWMNTSIKYTVIMKSKDHVMITTKSCVLIITPNLTESSVIFRINKNVTRHLAGNSFIHSPTVNFSSILHWWVLTTDSVFSTFPHGLGHTFVSQYKMSLTFVLSLLVILLFR